MSSYCQIHRFPQLATHTVSLDEPGQEPRQYEVCQECGTAMYNHDVGTLIRTGSQEQVKQLERSVANTQTRITSRKISHIPDRESPAGQDRQATETNRARQIRDAIQTAHQKRWEQQIEETAASSHSDRTARQAANEDQGPLIREDWLKKDDITWFALNVAAAGVAAASDLHLPHAETLEGLHRALELSTPRGVNDIPAYAQYTRWLIEIRIQTLKDEVTQCVQQLREREQLWYKMESERRQAQRDERNCGRDLY